MLKVYEMLSTGTKTLQENVPSTTVSNEAAKSKGQRPVTHQEVLKQLKTLRSDCSTGADRLPVKYIKLVAELIASPLTHIINTYIVNNSFPRVWKLA